MRLELSENLQDLWGMKRRYAKLAKEKWSERQDSNLRRLAPKASALPG